MSDTSESRFRLYLLILLMVVLWSGNYVISKFALREIPAMLVVGVRMLLSGIAMIPVYLLHKSRESAGWAWGDFPLLLALGVVGMGGNQLLFVCGLSRTSVAHAGIIVGLAPMLVLVTAAAVGQERLNRTRLAGMALALSGVALLQFAPSGRNTTVTGDLLVLLGVMTLAGFTVAGKAAIGRAGGVVVNTFAYVGTGLAMLPLTWYLGRNFHWSGVSSGAWASLLYMAVASSVIAYLIFYYALARIPASRLTAFAYLQPLFATIMAIPALGEYPTRSLLLGGALVLAGVFVAERVG